MVNELRAPDRHSDAQDPRGRMMGAAPHLGQEQQADIGFATRHARAQYTAMIA